MPLSLFAGVPVRSHDTALPWYEQLLGPAAFKAHAKETVWDLSEACSIYIVEDPDLAGHARAFAMVDDLDARVAEIAGRGLERTRMEEYPGGVRKAVYRDADGNEVGFLSTPAT